MKKKDKSGSDCTDVQTDQPLVFQLAIGYEFSYDNSYYINGYG